MSGPTRNRQTGLVFVCVGVVLGVVGSLVADGAPATIIYACAAAVAVLGLLITARGGRA